MFKFKRAKTQTNKLFSTKGLYMELDFKSIRALSSPTRLKILRKVLEGESTTTKLSDELEKSKSTISSHLRHLTEAGLMEKEKKEGRRRVVYRPTKKSEAILKGKERKVKFSIGSSALSAIGGTFLIWKDLNKKSLTEKTPQTSSTGDAGSFNAMDAGNLSNNTAEAAAQSSGGGFEQAFLFLGVGLLAFSFSTLVFGLALNYLSAEKDEKEIKVT